VEDLLSLPMLQPTQVTDPLHAYQPSKRANVLRVMAQAVTWGERGARLNAISPGIIITPRDRDELTGPLTEGAPPPGLHTVETVTSVDVPGPSLLGARKVKAATRALRAATAVHPQRQQDDRDHNPDDDCPHPHGESLPVPGSLPPERLAESTIQLSRTARLPYVPGGTQAVHHCAHNPSAGGERDGRHTGL
jgi:hypothetical protein